MPPDGIDAAEAARLIYSALQTKGWSSDSEAVVAHVHALHRGLPAEDEFSVILSWLGRCRLVHKLSQEQAPESSKDEFQVPDLLAVFEFGGREMAVLIEVKSRQKPKLSWTSAYMEALRRYGAATGLPVLVAWKYYGLWSLFDLERFQIARTNYHIRLAEAMKGNLLGVLAGDFAFVLQPGVGLHLRLRKEKLMEVTEHQDGRRELWHGTIDEAYFTNGDGGRVSKLGAGMWPLFLAAPLVAESADDASHIHQSFVIQPDSGMEFAHRAVTKLLQFSLPDGSEINWRRVLRENQTPTSAKVLRKAAEKGIGRGVVRYVFDIEPDDTPPFLAEVKPAGPKEK